MNLYEQLLCVKNLDSYPRAGQKEILERLVFAYYLRKGTIPGWLETMQKLAALAPLDFKFNPYHDPDNGQFTSGPNGPADDNNINDPPIRPIYPLENVLALILGGEAVTAAREALGLAGGAEAAAEGSTTLEGIATDHAAVRMDERDITDEQAQEAIQTAKQTGAVTTQTGKYGTPQLAYKGSNGITVITETSGRNAGKIITLYRH